MISEECFSCKDVFVFMSENTFIAEKMHQSSIVFQ